MCAQFAEAVPTGRNPNSAKPVLAFTSTGHTQLIDPASMPHGTHGAPIRGPSYWWRGLRGKGGDNLSKPFLNALSLSQDYNEKMLQAFLQQSAKQRDPWEIFYSPNAKFFLFIYLFIFSPYSTRTQKLVKLHPCPIFQLQLASSNSVVHHHCQRLYPVEPDC